MSGPASSSPRYNPLLFVALAAVIGATAAAVYLKANRTHPDGMLDPAGRLTVRTSTAPAAPAAAGSASTPAPASATPVALMASASPAATAAGPTPRDTEILAALADPKIVKAGKETYEGLCLACHGATTAAGDSPSNLFDGKWLHGSAPHQIENTIRVGVIDKGMAGWPAEILPPEDVTAVIAYLLSQQKK